MASDGEAAVLEIWGVWSTPTSPLLLGLLWPGVVVPIKVPSKTFKKNLYSIGLSGKEM